jgi:hypothetical protein
LGESGKILRLLAQEDGGGGTFNGYRQPESRIEGGAGQGFLKLVEEYGLRLEDEP